MPRVDPKPPRNERKLSDYKTQYANKDFPLLSFIYAIMAGGEHTLYCDHTGEYVTKYLGSAADEGYMQTFFKLMGPFEEMTENRAKIVHATDDDWDKILDLLKYEMKKTTGPEPKW